MQTEEQRRDWARLRALSDEVDATSSLVRHGLAILGQYRHATRDADAIFVCLAGGAEKLLKLTVGLYATESAGAWPSKSVMQGIYGHDIVALDGKVRRLVTDLQAQSTAPGYIRELLEQVDANQYLGSILATLARYAIRGRFYNLDTLAEAPQPEDSPAQPWEECISNF